MAEEVAAQLGARVLPPHETERARLPLAPVRGEPPREEQRVRREQLVRVRVRVGVTSRLGLGLGLTLTLTLTLRVLQVGLEGRVEGAARR